jgi:hypothetical protein
LMVEAAARTRAGTGVICEIWALPWAVIPAKAGIHPQAIENAPLKDWIPAFAGMTCVSKGIAFQMTPLPTLGYPANWFRAAWASSSRIGTGMASGIPRKRPGPLYSHISRTDQEGHRRAGQRCDPFGKDQTGRPPERKRTRAPGPCDDPRRMKFCA